MKKAIALLLALVMVFALCACGGGDKGTADNGEKVVKIGVFEPASGDSGAGGKKEMLGMQYANQETPTVEIGGETYKVELVYSDNGSDSAKAVSAASKLVNEKVSIVLGSYGSGVSIAASDTFKAGRHPGHWRDLHEPERHGGQQPLLPHLLPGSVPGHRPCQLCFFRAQGQEGLLPRRERQRV